MRLSDDLFNLDAPAWIDRAVDLIRTRVDATHRDGIVVALSGGLDSSVVVTLCARAIGADRVTALLMPERFGNPEALHFGREVAAGLGVRTRTIPITRALRAIHSANPLIALLSGRERWTALVERGLRRRGMSTAGTYWDSLTGTMEPYRRRTLADVTSKHRIRMVVAYKFAEEHGLLVAGAAHHTEAVTGLFCKYGVDDAADIMPLANLYRSEVLRVAEALELPAAVVARTPNPDIIPGVTDKYVGYFGIDYRAVDLIAAGWEAGMTPAAIARATEIAPDTVSRMIDVFRLSAEQRAHAVAPDGVRHRRER